MGAEGLDLVAGVVRVRRSLDRVRDEHGRYPVVAPKSRASRRDVPLTAEDVALLRRHRLVTGRREDDLVFARREAEALLSGPAYRAQRNPC